MSDPQTTDLANAMWQLLDDMGEDGLCVCTAAKAQARMAFEPFVNDMVEIQGLMSIEEARRIVKECEDAR